jgi:predicted Zn-dependent peptidase
MREYFQRRYSPRNIVVVGTGKIDFEAFVKSVERYCGHWEPFDAGRTAPPATAHPGFYTLHKPSATQEYVVQLAAGPAAHDDDRYAAKILSTVVGDDTGSRLFWELIDPGLAENAAMGHSDYLGAGLFMTYMGSDPELTADNLQSLKDLYRQIEQDGFTQAELDQAKSKIASRIVLSGERPRGRLWTVGGNWTQRREYRSIKDDLDAVDAVTLDDLHAVLAKYPLSKSTTVAIGPLEELAAPE